MRIGMVTKATSPRGGTLGNTFFPVISYFFPSIRSIRYRSFDCILVFFFFSILGFVKRGKGEVKGLGG